MHCRVGGSLHAPAPVHRVLGRAEKVKKARQLSRLVYNFGSVRLVNLVSLTGQLVRAIMARFTNMTIHVNAKLQLIYKYREL